MSAGPPVLRARLLRPMDLRFGERQLPPLDSARAESLLAYLLLHLRWRPDAPLWLDIEHFERAWQSRLGELPVPTRSVLKTAAVLGARFRRDVLAA